MHRCWEHSEAPDRKYLDILEESVAGNLNIKGEISVQSEDYGVGHWKKSDT